MNRTLSLLLLVLLSSPAASQTRVRPMGEFRADAKGVSFVATFEARSSGKFVMEVNQRIDAASVFSSSHCTVAADGVAGWADSTTALVNQDLSRPQAPEKIEYEGPELPSADCVIRVDRTIHASGSQYSLAVRSRALQRYPSAAATVTQAQALAFIGKLRGTATVTLAMSTVAPGSATNPNVAVDTTPAPTSVDQPYFEFQVEKQATPRPGNAQPPYPDMLKSANVEGEVVAQFVVDVNLRFDPAEIAGRKVRQIVQMPFVFSLKK